jgi:hypothetical protein
MDWYKYADTGDVTHYCKGVEKKEEIVERYKEGIQGNTKPKGTNNEGTMWFNPSPVLEDGEDAGRYKCTACGTVSPESEDFVMMGVRL